MTLSVYFAKERIIYTDTAAYFGVMLRSNNHGFYIATNRFICLFSQILPALTIAIGLPLKWVLYAYSINFILIPLIGVYLCVSIFKSKETAIAILLFYILMSRWVFYYPVSEFQIGLCFLLVYHAFLLHFIRQSHSKNRTFYVVSFIMVVVITFSHPLAILVLFAWLIWLLVDYPINKKPLLFFPAIIAIVAKFIRDHFFKAMVGDVSYDASRQKGLDNFRQPVNNYFDSALAKSFSKVLTEHYFIWLILFAGLILFFLWKKRWLRAVCFGGIIFGFWLLVTVTFKDLNYNHYTEHLYQALPFFVALAAGKYVPQIFRKPVILFGVWSAIGIISCAKIVSNHIFFTQRLQWYQNFINLMHRHHIQKGALSPQYVLFDTHFAYWASSAESLILSSLHGPDSSVYFRINWDIKTLNQDLDEAPKLNPQYFHLDNQQPYIILDSIAPPGILNKLKWEVEKK